ncbi:hypothetical protein [uncultured Clostridium sp.]|uniref:hypothetical protein n=1 Tax=uncultured Clostridium sp. TaxID=59620 RepID=UPI0025FEBFFC|nr:hypothetical protein [uncultured Clostridium sp.]
MQSNISLNFIQLTKIINEEKIEELNSFLNFHMNAHVTCNEIANRLDISFEDAKKIIRILLKANVLEMNFKIDYCDEYLTARALYYETIEDIPDEVCEDCDKRCQLLRKVIIVYKVVKEEFNEKDTRN